MAFKSSDNFLENLDDLFITKEDFEETVNPIIGTIWAWGANYNGQLGDETVINKSSPIQVGSLNTWKVISGGSDHAIAIK